MRVASITGGQPSTPAATAVLERCCFANVTTDPGAASWAELSLGEHLDVLARRFETPDFIAPDPVSLPHRYVARADIEIAGFVAAMFAWGQRPTILAKAAAFLDLLDGEPHAFIRDHRPRDRRRFARFVHRTFQPPDAAYVVERLQRHYREHASLESLFAAGIRPEHPDVRAGLVHFHEAFFDTPEAPARTRKHLATPARASACKRLNLFLRWMVRPAAGGVDFGLWRAIAPRQLVIPLDVHVHRMATDLGLLDRRQADWQAAAGLTARLREFDPDDPVRFDFALFGLGVARADEGNRSQAITR